MPEAAPVTSPVAHGAQLSTAVAAFVTGCRAAMLAAGGNLAAQMKVAATQGVAGAVFGPGDSHVATGSPTVLVNGLRAGRVGDLTDRRETVVAGSSSVFVNGRPAARLGDPTDKAGVIVGGSRTVFIGGGTTTIGKLGPVMNPECGALAKAADLATMANHAYGKDPTVPPGYTFLDPTTQQGKDALAKLGLQPADVAPPRSTFRADIFTRPGIDGDQYVVAYKGTNPKAWEDVKTDLQQGAGFDSGQYKNALRISQMISQNPDVDVDYTGHSLGGGLASASAASQNRPATTFNAAGLSARTIGGYPAQAAPVDAYSVSGEPLSAIQDHRLVTLGAIGPLAMGFDAYRSLIQRSPVLPKAYGTRYTLPRAAPAGSSASDPRGLLNWHSMDWVNASLAARRAALGCM